MNELIKQNQEWIDSVWEKLDKKLSKTAIKSREIFPYSSKDGVHTESKWGAEWWTNGFWGGLMWLMYLGTEKDCYKITAEENENKKIILYRLSNLRLSGYSQSAFTTCS